MVCATSVAIIVIVGLLLSATPTKKVTCDSSPQYFIKIENISGQDSREYSSGYSLDDLIQMGYKTIPANDPRFSRYPAIRQAINQPNTSINIDTRDVKNMSELSRDTILMYDGCNYLIIIAHYDRPAC